MDGGSDTGRRRSENILRSFPLVTPRRTTAPCPSESSPWSPRTSCAARSTPSAASWRRGWRRECIGSV
ncbi:hypothetical protein EYF80_062009 [Liparis tanakae]|uniref:Uncharacterized protein n=1 Tax=Liparis tanakae TaxID=230148 RepID=A0A4Z2EGI7_9TELE|nr:hypothetical protein EYF80_062009 [Liparis tanakae]